MISALTHATLVDICQCLLTRALAAGMMRGAQAVATPLGISFRVSIDKCIACAEGVGKHNTSRLQDIEAAHAQVKLLAKIEGRAQRPRQVVAMSAAGMAMTEPETLAGRIDLPSAQHAPASVRANTVALPRPLDAMQSLARLPFQV